MCDASDEIAWIKAHRLRRPESTRSPSEARAQMGAVDHVNEHWTIEILFRVVRSWGHMWTHQGIPIFIGRAKDDEIVGSWPTIAAVGQFSPTWTICDFC